MKRLIKRPYKLYLISSAGLKKLLLNFPSRFETFFGDDGLDDDERDCEIVDNKAAFDFRIAFSMSQHTLVEFFCGKQDRCMEGVAKLLLSKGQFKYFSIIASITFNLQHLSQRSQTRDPHVARERVECGPPISGNAARETLSLRPLIYKLIS